jgi:hypothetical protein
VKIQIKFDPNSRADRDRVRAILDSLPATNAAPPREDKATEAVLDIMRRHGGEARHGVIQQEMRANDFPGWLTPKRHLIKTGRIKQRGRGLYYIVVS